MNRGKRAPRTDVVQDYTKLKLTPQRQLMSFVVAALMGAVLVYVFYQNVILSFVGLGLGVFGPAYMQKQLIARRATQLNSQFKDFLHALNAAVSARISLSNAVRSAYKDLSKLYYDEDMQILVELRNIIGQLDKNMKVHEAITLLAQRSHDEDILSFANVLQSVEGVSQDALPRLIERTVNVISEKIEVKREIETSVAAMKMEQKIMAIMPVIMVLFINLVMPDYMAPLYSSSMGYAVITGALLVLIGAVWLSGRIMDIKV